LAPPIVRADCTYPSGEVVTLPATNVSVAGAFIVTMISPPIGATVIIRLHLAGNGPQSPFPAQVIAVRIDPCNAMRSGFEVVFTDVDDETLCRLGRWEEDVVPSESPLPVVAPERRVYPRVATRLRAAIRVGKQSALADLRNLSMSGARLEFSEELRNIELSPPSEVTLALGGTLLAEELTLPATVIWCSYEQSRTTIGVRFAPVSPDVFRTLEEVLLYSLIGETLPKIPRGCQ